MRSPPSPPAADGPNSANGNTIPPPLDASSVKLGPPLLPDATTFDPLRNISSDDYFWNYVDNYFQPLNKDDVVSFRRLPPSRLAADDASNTYFPIMQRLVAALLDSDTPTSTLLTTPPVGVHASAVGAVTVGTCRERQRQQDALETRVRHELVSVGLLDSPGTENSLDRATRTSQWRLRELKASNAARQRALARAATVGELKDQLLRREEQRHEDSVQIVYLNRLLGRLKKNKKSRGKLQKLLTRNFGHYDHVDSAPPNKNKKRKKPDGPNGAAPPPSKKVHKGAPAGKLL